MNRIDVYDPAMCCSTGVCGPDPEVELARFSADLQWLGEQGVEVHRYNLAQEPGAFVENEIVRRVMTETDGDGLPVILRNGQLVSQGVYPTRVDLANAAGLRSEAGGADTLIDDRVVELIAVAASVAAGCEPCLEYHHQAAEALGVSRGDMIEAVNIALKVKHNAARNMANLAQGKLAPEAADGGCCGSSGCC